MPPKRSNLNKRKSSSNLPTVSESEKNAISKMFKRIESFDSTLIECNMCHFRVKSCLLKDHEKNKCEFRSEKADVDEIIIIDEITNETILNEEEASKISKKVEIEDLQVEDENENCKRIKLENDTQIRVLPNRDLIKMSDQIEDDNLLSKFVDNLDEKNLISNKLIQEINETEANNLNEAKTQPFDYYLDNFVNAIQSVLAEEQFSYLFDQNDMLVFEKFNSMSHQAKNLYVRLFQRKFKWIPAENIVYERISNNLDPFLNELIMNSFLFDQNTIQSYEEIIYLFKLPQLRELAKACHVTNLNNNQTNKTEIIKIILQHFRTQKSLKSHFFKPTNVNNNVNNSLTSQDISKSQYMIQCKKILGQCFKLEKNVRSIFVRALILYSLSSSYQADLNDTGQQKLLQLLMINMKNIKFMNYEIKLNVKIFKDKQSFIDYEQALEEEFELLNLIDMKEYDEAFYLYENKISNFQTKILDMNSNDYVSTLPSYLRVFSSGSVYSKLLSIYSFEILQRLKKYKEANEIFEFLLNRQSLYQPSSRHKWFERLAINYESHLKDPIKSFKALKNGLEDTKYVKKAGRLGLYKRLVKMSQTKKYLKIKELKNDLENITQIEKYEFKEAPTVEIEGTLLHTSEFIPGRKNVFIQNESFSDSESNSNSNSNSNGLTISVEQVALTHYIKNLEFTNGKHAETITLTTLYGILFWDIIFDNSIYNVFVDKFQHGPLDLQTSHFYMNRKESIDSKIELLKNSSLDTICDLYSENWKLYYGFECYGVSWDLFESLDELLSLIKCFNNIQLANLCNYMSQNYRYCRSGGPDLILWSTKVNKFKFVEVKGPGDHLSFKQMVWLDFFINNSIDCEVCYVKGLNSKRIRQ